VNKQEFFCQDIQLLKNKALQWAATHFDTYMFLNGNNYNTLNGAFPDLLAIGVKNEVKADQNAFDLLREFINKGHNGLFGYLSYDLKNEIEKLKSSNQDLLKFPALHFFEPQILIRFQNTSISIEAENSSKIYELITSFEAPKLNNIENSFQITQKTNREKYIKDVRSIIRHIEEGDIYELNYCINFIGEEASIDPISLYIRLNQIAPTPFSTLFKSNHHSIVSASPERFLKKVGNSILSQPMKGTIGRGKTEEEDLKLSNHLRNNEKEMAENMMIVDLVRNDLAKSCRAGTVKVDDLFGIYQFPTVHQMISTISGELKTNMCPVDVIKNAFPMGSMTGAPKIKAMELIERFESFKRGSYSGSAGYIAPNGDFDFNVLIRSVFYNEEEKHLSIAVGSAITYDSIPEQEYEECLLKADILIKLLSKNSF
jgi:para-aminobenzoate synthetase component 1